MRSFDNIQIFLFAATTIKLITKQIITAKINPFTMPRIPPRILLTLPTTEKLNAPLISLERILIRKNKTENITAEIIPESAFTTSGLTVLSAISSVTSAFLSEEALLATSSNFDLFIPKRSAWFLR